MSSFLEPIFPNFAKITRVQFRIRVIEYSSIQHGIHRKANVFLII